jgi:hypothetical protein
MLLVSAAIKMSKIIHGENNGQAIIFKVITFKMLSRSGPYYPSGTIGTVPRAYEGMEGGKVKMKNEKYENMKI